MKRVVIVGGGVIGLSAAWALQKRGCAVTIVEANTPGHGASAVNAGWICPSLSEPIAAPGVVWTALRGIFRPDSPLYIQPRLDVDLVRWLLGFWRHCNARDYSAGLAANAALNQQTMALYDEMITDGIRFEEHREGILFAYISPSALDHDIRAMEPLRQYGIEVPTPVWGDDIRVLEPALSTSISGGFLYAGERHVRPDSLAAGLVAWLRGQMVTILTDAAVTGFDQTDNRIDAVRTTQGRIAADAVLLCTGAWTGQVAKLAGVKLPFQGGKGYSLDYAPAPVAVRRPLYLHEARVAVTPMNGMVRLAGTMEFSGLNEMIQEKRVDAIARAAAHVLDGWPADHRVATVSSGLRPMTPDGLSTIGWLTGFRNAAVAAGHAMLGVTLAPATAVAVAELLTTGTTPDVLRPFDPSRFD